MGTHRIHNKKEVFYFVTFTCYRWLPLIGITSLYDYFKTWIERLSLKGLDLSGYVIMPNHIHLLLFVRSDCKGLNFVLGEAKRFMAYEIVKRLTDSNNFEMLNILNAGVQNNEKQKGKKHQVFRLSFDAKELIDEKALLTVLDYIHHNPVKGKWNLIDDYTDYPYSSASYYEKGKPNEIELKDYRSIISESSSSDSE